MELWEVIGRLIEITIYRHLTFYEFINARA